LRFGRKADDVGAGVSDEDTRRLLVTSVNALGKCKGLGGRGRGEHADDAKNPRPAHRATPGSRRWPFPREYLSPSLARLDCHDHDLAPCDSSKL
jgi:hypothetical protein